jgi:stearoyl-CoA desaturase (Delta-9 desaturase)
VFWGAERGAVALAVFLITSALQIFGITTGYHRLLAHRSFKTTRTFQFVLAMLGVLAGQNGPLWWVGHHRHHHRYSDREPDVHSPNAGFFWSHMGWLFSPRCVAVRHELVRDLQRCRELRLLQRYYYVFNLGYAFLLYGWGEAWHYFDPSAGISGFQLFVWGSVVSTVCVYHSIWSANSFCHRYGTRRFGYARRQPQQYSSLVADLGRRLASQPSLLPLFGQARVPMVGS